MRNELQIIFAAETLAKVDEVIEQYKNTRGTLLIVLEKIQDICGYLPLPLQRYIASRISVSPSQVHGVVTFYSYFSTVPKGRNVVKVCTGTACYVKGSNQILKKTRDHLCIKEGEITADGKYSVEEVRCLGACGLAPVVVVGEQAFGLVNPEKAEDIFAQHEEDANVRSGAD